MQTEAPRVAERDIHRKRARSACEAEREVEYKAQHEAFRKNKGLAERKAPIQDFYRTPKSTESTSKMAFSLCSNKLSNSSLLKTMHRLVYKSIPTLQIF